MMTVYSRTWGSLLLRGWALLAFGLLAMLAPATAVGAFGALIGVVLIASGLHSISTGLRLRSLTGWGWFWVVEGSIAIGLGAVAFAVAPAWLTLLMLIAAALALSNAVSHLALAWRLRDEPRLAGFVMAMGFVAIGFATLLIWQPILATYGLIGMLGVLCFALGGFYAVLGLRLRRLKRDAQHAWSRDTALVPRWSHLRAPGATS
ncbi:MAG TPA: DUF308 domain-containing protein [Burkholderiaceae bacterium]|nr:DUF308 domain-containing protein [Burkholderiaceae bacterium]